MSGGARVPMTVRNLSQHSVQALWLSFSGDEVSASCPSEWRSLLPDLPDRSKQLALERHKVCIQRACCSMRLRGKHKAVLVPGTACTCGVLKRAWSAGGLRHHQAWVLGRILHVHCAPLDIPRNALQTAHEHQRQPPGACEHARHDASLLAHMWTAHHELAGSVLLCSIGLHSRCQ